MKEVFLNKCIVTGYLNSGIEVGGSKGSFKQYSKFFVAVPRHKSKQDGYTPLPCVAWGEDADIVSENLTNQFGKKITIVARIATGTRRDGSRYFVLNVLDFCFGWYDMFDIPKLGLVYKAKLGTSNVEELIKDLEQGEI